MGKGLGLGTVSEKPFLEIFNMALPHVKLILDEMCEEAKQLMKDILDGELGTGSWARGVTTCDGCWEIRGHFQMQIQDKW